MQKIQDWEHEAHKDFIYLQEELMLLKQEILEEMNRKPANIIIINEDKINKDEHKPKLPTISKDPERWI